MPTLYRVENPTTKGGLWYTEDGRFTEFVRTLDGYRNADLPMGFEEHMAGGWHSAVDDLSMLQHWFNFDEMTQLEERGYGIYAFDVEDYRIGRSETGIEHAVFRRDKVTNGYRRLSRSVLL